MYDDSDSPFRFSIPPTAMPPSLAAQAEAFQDVAVQLIANLNLAAKDKSDPWPSAYVLACCDRVCSIYACAGFDLLAEFQHELRTDLRNALRKARQAFLDDGRWRRPPNRSVARADG
jgi:hypothetical protein